MLLESSLFIQPESVALAPSSPGTCKHRGTGTIRASLHSVEWVSNAGRKVFASAGPPCSSPDSRGGWAHHSGKVSILKKKNLNAAQHPSGSPSHTTMKTAEGGSTQDVQMEICSDNTLGSEALWSFEAFVNMGNICHSIVTADM